METLQFGITIGPVYATLLRTSTPAGMWFVSTMFSRISEELCKRLLQSGLKESDLYAPYYSNTNPASLPEGVGLYHDRILFTANEDMVAKLPAAIQEVRVQLSDWFAQSFDGEQREKAAAFMREYLQIHWVWLSDLKGNPVAELNAALDALELQAGYLHTADDGSLVKMLEGEPRQNNGRLSQNQYIKQSFLMCSDPAQPYSSKNAICPQILQAPNGSPQRNLRNVLDIAEQDDAYDDEGNRKPLPPEKHRRYMALVKADGDRMGQTLTSLPCDEIRKFSECCLEYGAKAADAIGKSDGVTVYAGGDDLLFLAPTQGILQLCENINRIYQEKFARSVLKKDGISPSLSFGVQICFYRFPLYESLQLAGALQQQAKEQGGNRIALSLQKASGNDIHFVLRHSEGTAAQSTIDKLIGFLEKYVPGTQPTSSACDGWLQSAIHTVALHHAEFAQALRLRIPLDGVFGNLFHQDVHQKKETKEFLDSASALMETLHRNCAEKEPEKRAETVLQEYDALLRFTRFYLEKGEET